MRLIRTHGPTDDDTTRPDDPSVTGPHAGYDRYGRFDHYYWRCERCGHETTDAGVRHGCPNCGDGAGDVR